MMTRIEDERLIFEKTETIKRRLKHRFAHLKGQGVVDELIAERRIAAPEEE